MKKSVFFLCALTALLAFGCGDDDKKPEHRLIVSDHALGFESNGGNQSFEVASNVDWTVTVDETWCTVSPKIGYANGTVNVNVAANNGAVSRTALVTVYNTEYGLSEGIVISQEGKPQGLDVSLLPGVWKSVTSENEDGTVMQYNANWHIVFTLNSNGTFEWDLDNPSPNLDVLVTGSWTASVVTQSLVLQGTMYVGGTLFGENHDVYFIEELTEETLVILNQVTLSKMTFSKNVWMDNAGYAPESLQRAYIFAVATGSSALGSTGKAANGDNVLYWILDSQRGYHAASISGSNSSTTRVTTPYTYIKTGPNKATFEFSCYWFISDALENPLRQWKYQGTLTYTSASECEYDYTYTFLNTGASQSYKTIFKVYVDPSQVYLGN